MEAKAWCERELAADATAAATSLCVAAEEGDEAVVHALLAAGAEVDAVDQANGRAVQVDSIKSRVESAYAFSA